MTADNHLRLGDHAAATNVWGYWAGRWGMPGHVPYSYFHAKVPDRSSSWSLRAYPDGSLQWGDNAWDYAEGVPHPAAEDMLFHAAAREDRELLPSEVLLGVCTSLSTFENCTYIGASGDRLSLMPADRALTFEYRCVPCESRPLNGDAAGVLASLLGLALLPLGLYRLWLSRRKLPPKTQWPAAPRSSLAWLLFLLSWVLVILGLTPAVLWYVGRWWNSHAESPMALAILGVAGMQMCLRQDDPIALLRLVSVLNVLARLMLSWFLIHEASIWSDRIFSDDGYTSDYGRLTDEQRDYPLSTSFGRLAVDGVNFIGAMVVLLLVAVFCVSQIPLWYPAAKRGQPQPLRWLWRTMRAHVFATAIVLFITSFATVVIGFIYRDAAYPSEHQRGMGLLILNLSMGTGLLVSALATSEVLRLRIHLRHISWWRGIAITSVKLGTPHPEHTEAPPAPVIELADAITAAWSGTTAASATDASSDKAVLADAPFGVTNATPLSEALNAFVTHQSPLLANIASLWSGVDVSAWRDPEGRFDALRLLSRIGHGGYASVFLAELGKPLILSAGVTVGGVTDAGWSAGEPSQMSGGFRVAVKVFNRAAYQDAAEVRRMHSELQMALSLASPYVVRTLGMTLLGGNSPALVMELMAGSLADLLWNAQRAVKPLSDAVAAAAQNAAHPTRKITDELKRRILLEVALGLEFLHSMGIVHRDIKPANVLLDGELHAKIGDFGIATRFAMETLTADVGTARYMAPEILFGPYDERADIFAFGVLTWETLHEAVAFGETSPLAAVLNIQKGLRPRHNLSEDLANLVPLIEVCWAMSADERPQRMSAVIETLEGCGAVLGVV